MPAQDHADYRQSAISALKQEGFTWKNARAAVDAAVKVVGTKDLGAIIRESLHQAQAAQSRTLGARVSSPAHVATAAPAAEPAPSVCKYEDCGKVLRSNNRTGFCHKHHYVGVIKPRTVSEQKAATNPPADPLAEKANEHPQPVAAPPVKEEAKPALAIANHQLADVRLPVAFLDNFWAGCTPQEKANMVSQHFQTQAGAL